MGLINGLILTNLSEVNILGGNVYKSMRIDDPGYCGFGEAYFSAVMGGHIKSWKMHKRVTLNLTVITGLIRFVVLDTRFDSATKGVINQFILGRKAEFSRLTIPPNLWMAFQGIGDGENIVLNIIDLPHDPNEAERMPLENFKFNWTDL